MRVRRKSTSVVQNPRTAGPWAGALEVTAETGGNDPIHEFFVQDSFSFHRLAAMVGLLRFGKAEMRANVCIQPNNPEFQANDHRHRTGDRRLSSAVTVGAKKQWLGCSVSRNALQRPGRADAGTRQTRGGLKLERSIFTISMIWPRAWD